MENEKRDALSAVFIGTNRTGKTTVAVDYIKEWKKTHKGMVIVHDPQHVIRDGVKIDYSIDSRRKEKAFEDIYNMRPYDSLIVFDEFRMLHKSNQIDDFLLDLLFMRAQWCVDIIFIIHSPKLLLERMTDFINFFVLFYSESTKKAFDDRINNSENLKECQHLINSYRELYTAKTYKALYPNFPHIIFNQGEKAAEFKNINFK